MYGSTTAIQESVAFSSDTVRAIPSPALLPSATGSHPSGRSSEKLPAVLLGQMQLSITTLLVKMCLERPAGRDKHEIKTKFR